REVFPEIDSNLISVSVVYPGAAPEEVEDSICRRLEEAVRGIAGVKKVTSSANEGAGATTIEVIRGQDTRRVLDDVKARIDAIDTFPVEAEEPLVSEVVLRRQAIHIAVASPSLDERGLKM